MDSDWSNIPADIGYVILCNLPELVDHIWFGAVCKNWYSFVKQYNQLNRPSRGTLPMFFIPVRECTTQRRFLSIPNRLLHSNQVTQTCIPNTRCSGSGSSCLGFMGMDLSITPFEFKKPNLHPNPNQVTLSHIPNKRCCGSSFGWLAFTEKDFSVTLINPFKFKGLTIHLPILKTQLIKPYDCTISKLILTPDSTPDSYTVVAIHSGTHRLATIKCGEKEWTYIEYKKIFNPKLVTLTDIVFHKGLVYAIDYNCKIFSFDVYSRPVRMNVLNQIDLPRRNREKEHYRPSYIVESTSGNYLYVIRKQTVKGAIYMTQSFKVMKLEFHPEKGIRVRAVESLNGDTVFLSEIYSTAVKSSNFDWCQANSIYFTDEFAWDYRSYDAIEDSGIYNVEDKSLTRLCLRDTDHTYTYRRNSFWVQPPYN